jgi:hypothetical protein
MDEDHSSRANRASARPGAAPQGGRASIGRSMTRRRPTFPVRVSCAAIVAASLAAACAWEPWIPGERSWNPDIVASPADLSPQLGLDSPYVGKLDCYAQRCQKRFRVILDQPGQLTVTAIPRLASPDDQMRIVLEGFEGVLKRAGSGRGPRGDVTVLTVTEPVHRGVYFLLIQSVGGPVPYQLTAHLAPGEGAPVPSGVETARAEPALPPGPPVRLVNADLPGGARGGYDPSVDWAQARTFRFAAPAGAGDAPPGVPVEQPIDRQIRYLIGSELEFRGLRQASGSEAAALQVDFSRRSQNRELGWLSPIYDRYDVSGLGWMPGERIQTRATLTVDIVDLRSDRLAWHAQTTKSLGPGITPGEKASALLREAVTEVLAGFPPR